MSGVGLVNLLQNLSNENATPEQDAAPAPKESTQSTPIPLTPATDQFIPSAQNAASQATAQAAGIFSVAATSFFSSASASLLAPNNSAPTIKPPASVPVRATAAAAATATTANPPAPQSTAPVPAQAPATTASGPVATLVSAQEQLQSLNLALAALGLSNQDIQQLDQVASTTSDYNPSAYTAHAYQLELLARQPASHASTAPPETPPAPAQANAATAKSSGAGSTAKTA